MSKKRSLNKLIDRDLEDDRAPQSLIRMTPYDSAGRRALWIYKTPSRIELRSGREGDDASVQFKVGQTLTAEDLDALWEVIDRAKTDMRT
jgi:hypothetical protein